MSYTFLKPKMTNIYKDTWNIVKTKWIFWLPLPFIFLFPFVGFPILMISVIYFIVTLNRTKMSFWKEFARINGWQYKNGENYGVFDSTYTYSSPDNEPGLMFKEGYNRIINNEINGVIQGRTFRIFCYQFSFGAGKNKRVYYYTVFGFKFNGTFPHIYLNCKKNMWGMNIGEKISLPVEFENKFSLFAPREYEIEALEIFTPDILAKLLDNGFSYDIEFINKEVLIFVDGIINNSNQLEIGFNKALEFQDIVSKKLDKFNFEQIGDRPSVLK